MRKLIMWNLITLDGYFEGAKNWDLPWHEQLWGEELERFSLDQLQSADMLVFGRVTYEGMAEYWPTAVCAAESEVVTFWRTSAGQSSLGVKSDFLLPYGLTG